MGAVDATTILEGALYQGSAPPIGAAVRRAGFSVLVLCAKEVQPVGFDAALHVIRAPFDDTDNPSAKDLMTAERAGKSVAKLVAAGHRVLVTCAQGRNRSGLVTAIALRELTGASGKRCMTHVRLKRHGALTNPAFQKLLLKLPPKQGG